jgi:hypothetical protein
MSPICEPARQPRPLTRTPVSMADPLADNLMPAFREALRKTGC